MTNPIETQRGGAVFTVTINRPQARNAVDRDTAQALYDAFKAFDGDEDLSVAVLTGAGGNFCAGADLKAVSEGRGNVTRAEGDLGPMGPTRLALSKPVIAAVEGYAVAGGLELAAWCDLRVASASAVFGVFLAQKLAGKPYTVVGDGTQTRDFTFVSDIVGALIAAAESDVSGEAINIGSDNTYSVNQLVELLGGDVVHIPKRPGEPDCTWADISKAKTMLNWSPKVSLEEGVAILLENIDYWREAPVWDEKTIAVATEKWFEYFNYLGWKTYGINLRGSYETGNTNNQTLKFQNYFLDKDICEGLLLKH